MTGTPASRGYRAVVLGMLLLVYTFNFVDRQILGILAGPIKDDLGLRTRSSDCSAASPSPCSIRRSRSRSPGSPTAPAGPGSSPSRLASGAASPRFAGRHRLLAALPRPPRRRRRRGGRRRTVLCRHRRLLSQQRTARARSRSTRSAFRWGRRRAYSSAANRGEHRLAHRLHRGGARRHRRRADVPARRARTRARATRRPGRLPWPASFPPSPQRKASGYSRLAPRPARCSAMASPSGCPR